MYLNQFQYTYEKDSVHIFGRIIVGASGAVTNAKGGGLISVTKSATAGQYVVTLRDKWSRLLHVHANSILATPSGIANVQVLMDPSTLQTGFVANHALTFQCVDYAGAAVNPASGEEIQFMIIVRKSSVGPYDNTFL